MSLIRNTIREMAGYVPGEQPREMELVKLNTNENPYPCSPRVKAAIGRVLQAGLQRYPDPQASEFRLAAARLLAPDLPQIDPDWILCGNGSDDILTIVTRAFVGEGDLVRFPRPSYLLYGTLASLQGAHSETVDFTPDWRLDERFGASHDRLRLAYLPNPNSPSGTVLTPTEVAALADRLPCPLVVDEAYVDFADQNCLALVAQNDRILVTRTLSKSYALAGLRFGYLVAQPHIVAELNKVKDSYNCDALSIAGATAAIEDRDWFSTNRSAVLATRRRMETALAAKGFAGCPSSANFLWRRHASRSSLALYQHLKANGVLVRYMNYGPDAEGLRISVGSDAQVDRLLELL